MTAYTSDLHFLDANAPWVASLASAAASFARTTQWEVYPPQMSPYGLRFALTQHRSQRTKADTSIGRYLTIPGWHRFQTLSLGILRRNLLRAIKHDAKPVVVFSSPWYAPLARPLAECGAITVYNAHDTFRHYGWDRNRVIALEEMMVRHCKLTLCVAKLVCEDLSLPNCPAPIYYPMATKMTFLTGPAPARPADLPTNDLKTICITGFINESYDWELLEEILDACPVNIVLVGPISTNVDPEVEHLRNRFPPRFFTLGKKEHSDIPAYIQHSDILLNPLKVNDHNNRRCPLRLFDYLTTSNPIISTDIAEASLHLPHISIAHTRADAVKIIMSIKCQRESNRTEVYAARRAHLNNHTWEKRAMDLLEMLENASHCV